ncbi:MAG: tRNA lysidine(34) synthetase TilS [Xanthobacteraceae bacterium]
MPAAENRSLSASEARLLLDYFSDFPVLLIASSGGSDSTALLWLMARWRNTKKKGGPKLIAVTIDHALRPESKREAQAVARLARKLGVEHRTLRWTGKKPKTGIQEAARLARYRLLSEAARKTGANCVLTAHTLDDQAETVLFRLARGSGIGGLAGMAHASPVPIEDPGGILLVRPLLGIPKSRLLATLKAAKVPYADDPTNRDPRFARPRLRELMPLLAREGLSVDRLALLAWRARRAEFTLHQVVSHAATVLSPGPWTAGEPVKIEARAFFELPDEIGLRLLGRAIDTAGDEGPVELGKLEALCEALFKARHTARFRRTLAGAAITLARGMLAVERAPARSSRAPKRP